MNVEKWLEEVQRLDQMIEAKIAERDRLRELATSASAKPMDGMPFNNTGVVSQKVQDVVINLVMLSDEINELIDRYVDYKKQVIKVLEKLPAKEYCVLHMHYIRFKSWSEIAEKTGYSSVHIWRIRKNALKILENVIECNGEM